MVYLTAHYKGVVVHIPGTAVPQLLEHLQGDINEELMAALQDVAAALKADRNVPSEAMAKMKQLVLVAAPASK